MESSVIAVVMRCRGVVPQAIVDSLKILGIQTKHALMASLRALRSWIKMANEFLDYDHTTWSLKTYLLFIQLFIYLFIQLFIYLFIQLFIYLFVYSIIYLFFF